MHRERRRRRAGARAGGALGRPIVALDGCPLVCVRSSLARHGVEPALHLILSEHGVKQHLQRDFDPGEAETLLDGLVPRVRTLAGALA